MSLLRNVRKCARSLHRADLAQDLIEYALIAGLICLVIVGAASFITNRFTSGFSSVGNKISKHVNHGHHYAYGHDKHKK